MSRRRNTKPRKELRIVSPNDTGPVELQAHGAWRVIDAPVIGRRIMREPIHERLFTLGRVSADEWQAGEDYARDVGIVSGARDGGLVFDRVDGLGGANNAADVKVAAAARLRLARDRLGHGGLVRVMDMVCVDCVSVRELARCIWGDEGGGSRERVEELVCEGLRRLVR